MEVDRMNMTTEEKKEKKRREKRRKEKKRKEKKTKGVLFGSECKQICELFYNGDQDL